MALTQNEKFEKAIKNLKLNTEMIWVGSITTEEDFNKIEWVTDSDADNHAIKTTTNPHSELTWAAVKAEMDKT
tara:strand:+ start:563 stop:781 length:219 start_codon:yes stop_codon:yes gene_type:complete